MRLSGLAACAIMLVLPYRPRLLFAKVLVGLTHPPRWTAAVWFPRSWRFWNRVILTLVFFLGFPIASVLLRMTGRRRLGPAAESPTFFVPRDPPERIEAGIRDPF